jgi:hypothetical protein
MSLVHLNLFLIPETKDSVQYNNAFFGYLYLQFPCQQASLVHLQLFAILLHLLLVLLLSFDSPG